MERVMKYVPDKTAQISTIIGVHFDLSDLNIIVIIC